MMAVPAFTPEICPVVLFAIAIIGLLLVQVPPIVASVYVSVDPTHILGIELIVAGIELTVAMMVLIHPDGSVYVSTEVPTVIPIPIPVVLPIDILLLLLLHVPPMVGVALKVLELPIHNPGLPDIADGSAFTTIGVSEWQPLLVV